MGLSSFVSFFRGLSAWGTGALSWIFCGISTPLTCRPSLYWKIRMINPRCAPLASRPPPYWRFEMTNLRWLGRGKRFYLHQYKSNHFLLTIWKWSAPKELFIAKVIYNIFSLPQALQNFWSSHKMTSPSLKGLMWQSPKCVPLTSWPSPYWKFENEQFFIHRIYNF